MFCTFYHFQKLTILFVHALALKITKYFILGIICFPQAPNEESFAANIPLKRNRRQGNYYFVIVKEDGLHKSIDKEFNDNTQAEKWKQIVSIKASFCFISLLFHIYNLGN